MYSMGKGKLLRMENVQRPNGMYKVPITWEELSTKSYEELIGARQATTPDRARSTFVAVVPIVGKHVQLASKNGPPASHQWPSESCRLHYEVQIHSVLLSKCRGPWKNHFGTPCCPS